MTRDLLILALLLGVLIFYGVFGAYLLWFSHPISEPTSGKQLSQTNEEGITQ